LARSVARGHLGELAEVRAAQNIAGEEKLAVLVAFRTSVRNSSVVSFGNPRQYRENVQDLIRIRGTAPYFPTKKEAGLGLPPRPRKTLGRSNYS
jgi:hypothetical protein